MGHAHHFLSRLDRVSLPHVELALSLYNDAELLRCILYGARLPEGAERVAISLKDEEEGPFIVVTREGRFVTCLGEGMQVNDEMPVLTRGQLDAMADRVGALRARIDASRAVAGARGSARKLLRRVHEAADELSREEMAAFAKLAPLYAFELFYCLMDAANDLAEARDFLGQHLRRADRHKPQFRDALEVFNRTFWSIGHFAVLTAVNGKGALTPFPKIVLDELDRASLSWGAVRQGILSLALKGIWAVARIGKRLLPSTKARFGRATSPLTYLDSAMGLAALGLRHPKLAAEIRKELDVGPTMPVSHPVGRFLHIMHTTLLTVLDQDAQSAAELPILQAAFGAGIWQEASGHLRPGSPLRFERVEDMPLELAMSVAVNAQVDFLTHPQMTLELLSTLPWVARASPEMLYLPRAVLDVIHRPWEPEHSLALLRAHRDYYDPPAPPPSGPARQGPCPCGSGKKYKRCCGASKAAAG